MSESRTAQRGLVCGLTMLVLCMALPATVRAQGAAGEITGVVKDNSGAVLPGVIVEATSPALIERARSVMTASDGLYRIVGLPPGIYTVTFVQAGFAVFERHGLELVGDRTLTVNADMKVGGQEETIVVTAEAPIVDVETVERQTALSHDITDMVPTGKYFVNLGVLIPGLSASCSAACQTGVSQDTGGAAGDNMSTLIVHGSRFRDQRISINNMTVRGSTGYLGVTGPNIEAQQETQIDTSGADTSVGTGGVRINVVPKEGGNEFTGGLYATGANSSFQSSNLTSSLQAQGVTATTRLKKVYDVAPTLGGPLKRDTLWFFLSARYNVADNYQANTYQNANVNNPAVWTYAPNTSQPGFTHNPLPMAGVRLTWQASARNKFTGSFDYRDRCQCNDYQTGGVSPDAVHDFFFRPQSFSMLTWSSPVTGKLLLQASFVDLDEGWGTRPSAGFTGNQATMIPVVNAINVPASFLGVTTFRGYNADNVTKYPYRDSGFNATYVTGAHAFKVGVEYDWGFNDRLTTNNATSVTNISGQSFPITSYVLNFATGAPVPNSFITNLDPVDRNDKAVWDGALYAQDKWTINRITLSGGLRLDFFRRDTSQETEGPTLLQPSRNLVLASQKDVVNYKDLSPRLGLAWDLFGTGKTAVKVSLNRYVQDLSLLANNLYSAQQNYQSTATRSWTDSNNNFIPDCNPLVVGAQDNRATGGDQCGALTGASANFGTTTPADAPAANVVSGFNHRGYNWEFSTSVEQEVAPHHASLDVGFFRRWYGNFTVTDNPLTTASDYDPFSVTVPTDSRLPLSGQTVNGFTNVNPNIASVITTTQDVFASTIGKEYEHWTGLDISTVVRNGSTLVQGGLSSGRATIDDCAVLSAVPEGVQPTVTLVGAPGTIASQLGQPFCHQAQPWLTQWKALATYTIPNLGIQLSATYQNIPGPQLAANLTLTSTQVATTLGRPTAGNANVTVPLISPGTLYGARLTQTDLRIGKILRFGGERRITGSVDFYNLFNGAAPLTANSNYSTTNTSLWNTPILLQQGRLVKFTVVANF